MPTKERTKENCRCFDAADPRPRGYTPLRTPIRKSEGPQATRTQYYCSRLTPVGLPPIINSGVPPNPRCRKRQSVGAAYMPPAAYRGNPSTGKGGGLPPSLAPLVHNDSRHPVGAGHARPATLRQNPFNGSLRRGGIHPSRAPSAVANRKSPSGHRCRSATSPVRGGFSRGLRPRKRRPTQWGAGRACEA